LVHYIYFDRQRYGVNFGYHYDLEKAQGKNWSYNGHRAIAGFLVTLPADIRATTNIEYHARDYLGRNHRQRRFGGEGRIDNETTALFSLAKDITPNITLTLENLWNSDRSTISDYTYRRNVTSFGLTWRYY
jgi:hypothetical protein